MKIKKYAWTLHRLAFALHLTLILIHIALVAVWSKHYERRVTVSASSAMFTLQRQAITVVIPQTFVIVYLGALLTISQRLALSRLNASRQTLTSLHDQISAWNGLGSALLGIRDQLRLRTSFFQVVCIALYLGAFTVLHISTPALFSIDNFNSTLPYGPPKNTTLGYDTVFSAQATSDPYTESTGLYSISQFLPFYSAFSSTTPGLLGSQLYDSLEIPTSFVGSAVVNVTQFDVKCGTVPSASVTMSLDNTNWTITANAGGGFAVNLVDGIPPSAKAGASNFPHTNNVRFPILYSGLPGGDDPSNFVLRMTGPNILFYIYDSTSSSPPLSDSAGHNTTTFISSNKALFQIVGCSISAEVGIGLIDTSTNVLVSTNLTIPSRRNETWDTWIPASGATGIDGVDLWSEIFWPESNAPSFAFVPSCNPLTATYCAHPANVMEEFVRQGVYSSTPTLSALEGILANGTTAIYWNQRNAIGQAAVTQLFISTHLNLHTWPVFVGLACSISVFLLAAILLGVHPPKDTEGSAPMHRAELLQMALLSASSAHISEMGDKDGNFETNVRKAGMVEVLKRVPDLGYHA